METPDQGPSADQLPYGVSVVHLNRVRADWPHGSKPVRSVQRRRRTAGHQQCDGLTRRGPEGRSDLGLGGTV